MSLRGKMKIWFRREKSLKAEVERAYGLWLISPKTVSATKFISNMTGIPREQVWGILLGRSNYEDQLPAES